MFVVFSEQFQTPAVVVEDISKYSAEELITMAEENGALFEEDEGIKDLVLVLRAHIGPELYSREAVRRTIQQAKSYKPHEGG